ncbi:MAG: hypothetical protein KA354_07895 [Phycisphaerae bacterium]|nr:hypothetical protein [Phycisphaerae bacterium]
MCCDLTRRQLLSAAGAVGASAIAQTTRSAEPPASRPAGFNPLTRIRTVYLAKPIPTWPKPDLDVQAEVRRCEAEVAKALHGLPGIRTEGADLYRVANDVPSSAKALGNPDGLLVFNITSGVGQPLAKLAAMDLPVVLFSQPFSGHDWSSVAALRSTGRRVTVFATSDFAEITTACRMLDAVRRLRDSRILFIGGGPLATESSNAIRERFGTTAVSITPDRLNAAYRAVPEDAANADAQDWIRHAEKVVEPSESDIRDSSCLFLAIRKLMQEESAQAVTIDCLGLFARKVLPAYPCLAYCRLNDMGLTGVCEGDMSSTLTQLLLQYAFGVPGFVSDPVIDTARNAVIHAHCVSATRMDGPDGERCPYIIRSHLEDNKGVSLQVRMRVGQPITCAKLTGLDTLLVSTGSITDNPDVDRGCRTKITTKVADARKMLHNYRGGLHRVIVYGDRLNAIHDLAALLKLKVEEEC